jgi:hypothetical protein
MLALLGVSAYLAFAGVAVMFGAALWGVANARRLGKAGWDQMTTSMKAGQLREFFGSQGDRMRERFRREE